MRARLASDVSRQPGSAAFAEATAASTSDGDASATRAEMAPLAGSYTSAVCSGGRFHGWPPTQWLITRITSSALCLPLDRHAERPREGHRSEGRLSALR